VEYKGKIAVIPPLLAQLIAVFAARTRRDLTARDEMERIAAVRAATSRRRPRIASLFLRGLPARLPRSRLCLLKSPPTKAVTIRRDSSGEFYRGSV